MNLYRNPFGDQGYFLSVPGPTGFTISAPSGYYFSGFAFYWGSVDPWNQITFTGSNGSTTTVYGTNVCDDASGTCSSFSDPDSQSR